VSRHLAIFDFDGTITRKDTFLEMIKFSEGYSKFYVGLFLLFPTLSLYKLGLITNWRAKEIFFTYFFKNRSQSDFQRICTSFALNKLPSLIRPSALQEIQKHLALLNRVIIVTASAEEWIRPWSSKFGVELVTTHWQVEGGKLTGKILGRNCYGPVKKELILKLLNPADYETISVYGDTTGDEDMLSLGTSKFYKYFND
jgi:phosphatidylglycerophosphatase C